MTTSWDEIKSFCGTGAGRIFRDLGWRRKSRDSNEYPSVSPLPPALKLHRVSKVFGTFPALNSVNLDVQSGEVVALLGPSGCGKTTTLRIIAGFETPSSGGVYLEQNKIADALMSKPANQRDIGMVFQNGALFPHLTVEQNLEFALPKSDPDPHKISNMLEVVRMSDLRHRYPSQLSGGQQQRVALGRALINSPQLLLMDEPFSSLDSALRAEIREEVRQIVRTAGITTIFVTHDQQEAMYFGDTIAVMNNGSIEQYGTPEELFHAPRTRFVAEFMGAVDFVPCDLKGYQLQSEFNTVSVQNPYVVQQIQDDKDSLTFMSRPDCIELELDEVGHGTIVSREFYGAFYLYIVKLHSGALLRSLMPHTSEYQPGQSVSISIRDGHTLKTFLMDKLIEEVI
ncbi:MAG: ABC transporter ATP-binding protein [Dehalococcoidia bacterium]|jgi:iron(III) transport system ATP-binding protein|nr:ABC transporter ATP-binding protein [Dehalococcoidia bacterium]|tara:strand:+ start:110 stop:1303 length:1194 start_codon:yes stop_codon:yes gene_type:complete